MRLRTLPLALLLLAGCQTTTARLEDEWARFQSEYAAALPRLEALESERATRAKAGDAGAVVQGLEPLESPLVRAVLLSTYAGTAYEAGAVAELRTARDDLRALLAELPPVPAAPAAR